jgi:hypothetical protein
MAEQERLEARLADLARALDWPPTPPLAPEVGRRIARRRHRRRVVLALIAAALAIAAAGGAAGAVYLELRGATIQRVPHLPTPSTSPTTGGSAGQRLDLGQRMGSLADAARAAGFQPLAPAALGQPDEVYYRVESRTVTLLYRPRPDLPATADPEVGALVMEASASVDGNSFGKIIDRSKVEQVKVNGGPGFWISGAPHAFFFYASGGQSDTFRLAGDVLIWNQAGRVIRIESGLDRQRALAVAGTVR